MSNNNINFRLLAEEVKKRLDILEVAENEGLRLRKVGKNYFSFCPFHTENTPSFSVSQKKQIFNCFSCCKGGNVISLLATLRGVNKGKIIYQYAKVFGLIDNEPISRDQQQEMRLKVKKFEFKKKEESDFEVVYRFLCDQVHAFRRSMKQAKNWQEVEAMQHFYGIYDRLSYYEGLLEYMFGEYGERVQIEAYLKGEELMNEWNCQINN